MFNKKTTQKELIDGITAKLFNEMDQVSSNNDEKVKEDVYQNIQASFKNTSQVKIRRKRKMIIVLAATMVLFIGTAAISSAWRSNFIFSLFGQNENIMLLFDGKSRGNVDIYNEYSSVIAVKEVLSFTPYVFSYIPDTMSFNGCKSIDDSILDMFFEDSNSNGMIVFKQLHIEHSIKGLSFDETSTEKKKVNINGKKTILFITEYDENQRYLLQWTDDDKFQYILNGDNLPKDELLKMAESIVEMK